MTDEAEVPAEGSAPASEPSTPHEAPTIARGSRARAGRSAGSGERAPSQGAASDTLDTSPGLRSGSTLARRSGASRTLADEALAEVLLAAEAARAHGFAVAIGFVAAAVALYLPLLDGDPTAKAMAAVALGLCVVTSVWVRRRAGRPEQYTFFVQGTYAWVLATSVLFVENYIGFFSPVPVILTLGIYHLGQSEDRVTAFAVPIFAIVSYALAANLTVLGMLPDRGLFPASDVPASARVFAIAAVSVILGLTLRMARVARSSTERAIRSSHEAADEIRHRDAQLAEARLHLDRAIKLAIGKAGRYTGERAGNYELGVVIGIGAMGEVYAAEHVETRIRAAVKLMQPEALDRDELVERFLREGEICRTLDDPHIVRVYAVGRLQHGAPYMAMELLEGRDLAARLRHQPMVLGEVVSLARDVATGLEHAHAKGIVHRDLKPLNLFEVSDGAGGRRWKILDFGVSKLQGSTGTLTREGVVGTPGYMPPEQAKGERVDHRGDLFSLGVVLYRALTGRPAFPGESVPQVMFDIVYRCPEQPSNGLEHVPGDVDLVFAIALAKEPAERFQSARELADAFSAAGRRRLDPALRVRARALLARQGWGALAPVPAPAPAPERETT